MFFSSSDLLALSGLLLTATAVPLEKRGGFSCDTLASGLSSADCQYMSSIGMAGQGTNAQSDNGNIWIGDDGANTFTFTNQASGPATLIVWSQAAGDFQASFMSACAPAVSYSLPATGDSVTVSAANGVSGGWSYLEVGGTSQTGLTPYGQIDNTWGEFTTGAYATADVSREVNMSGSPMALTVQQSGCVSDMDTCVFQCTGGQASCTDAYELVNCAAGSQAGATYGLYEGAASGGCAGWSNGGHLDVNLG